VGLLPAEARQLCGHRQPLCRDGLSADQEAREKRHWGPERELEPVPTLFATPKRDDYLGRFVVSVGDKIELPAPLSFALGTSELAD
jgi:hypothetical protein